MTIHLKLFWVSSRKSDVNTVVLDAVFNTEISFTAGVELLDILQCNHLCQEFVFLSLLVCLLPGLLQLRLRAVFSTAN